MPKTTPRGRRNQAKKGTVGKASASTQEKIILVAENMFATHGIGAVSLRQITMAAGQGNSNAVQYHFKSKTGLVNEIFYYRISQLEQPRHRLMKEAEKRGLLSDARTLLEILCLPQMDILDERGRHTYAGFMIQYHSSPRPPSYTAETMQRWPVLKQLYSLILNRISFVPSDVARMRIEVCNLMFQNLVARMDDRSIPMPSPFSSVMDDRLEMMTAALCAPFRPGQPGQGYLSEALLRTFEGPQFFSR